LIDPLHFRFILLRSLVAIMANPGSFTSFPPGPSDPVTPLDIP
jgi:hypothetical protein